MQSKVTASQAKLLEQSYVRLCDPKEMGEIYKVMMIGYKDAGDVYPFLGEETKRKEGLYG